MLEELFVYGNLKDKNIQKEVLGRIVEDSKIGVLGGYNLIEIKIDNKVNHSIIPNKNFSVVGLVLLVTNEELKLLDKYEDENYKREKVVLVGGKEVWVYKS